MAYFPPYIDGSGLHMPTYEDRLSALCEAYRSIFGLESELSESVPDYQLLSVFARSLDDASALVLSAFHQMNPLYASGQSLDLLLPLYGLIRLPGETDAAARGRLLTALSSRGSAMAENILSEILSVSGVRKAALHVNDADSPDAKGIPAHSFCAVVSGGSLQKIAEAIFRKKAPGIGTWGATTKQVTDESGVSHDVSFSRPVTSYVSFHIDITPYEGFDASVTDRIRRAVVDYLAPFEIGQSLIVPSVYGVCYAAAGEKAKTFAITDLYATASAAGGTTRIQVPAEWNTLLATGEEMITIVVSGQ